MNFYTDGGCRGNGKRDAIGAAVAVHVRRWGKSIYWARSLPTYPPPTNQRAEIMGIILALKLALKRYQDLASYPRLCVTINTDSKYAIGCMTEWIHKWRNNEWTNARGIEVANRELIEKASDLHDRVEELGVVRYNWISREDNKLADRLCNDKMDEQ
ncbi:hypothetical protein N8T08_004639 [Aspergillus melleus]|uniref:Uncharacterized protein n=1 Tax=Aspergillus melleus TaxID=138277 RepID=A0ACC3B3C2_9EURO|nr:hypothetical protein N8T08_004639 [Aspergillus melleus]